MIESHGQHDSYTADASDINHIESALVDLRARIRCLRRALATMLLLAGLSIAGLCYCTVFLPNFPQSFTQFLMQSAVRLFCVVGLASLICLCGFSVLQLLYTTELARKLELRRRFLIGH